MYYVCMAAKRPELAQTELVEELPLACANEQAAVEFLERHRWGETPCCPHCGSVNVYKMMDRKTGERSGRFLWKCRETKGEPDQRCGKMFTVRTGMIYAESLIPLHKWVRAIWECSSAKNGCSALELSRRVQVTYKTALFLMHRIRHAMSPTGPEPKLTGIVEADETWVGARKPRHRGTAANPVNKRGKGTKKQPVCAVIQRGGDVRTRVIPVVNGHNIRKMLSDNVDPSARLFTDTEGSYTHAGPMFAAHERVNHRQYEYARGEVHTNTIEGFFARVKRGLMGVYHNVSKEHLHRYMDHFAFMHNTRAMNDGERTLELIRCSSGKRLMYRDPLADKSRHLPPPDSQLPPFHDAV